MFKIAAKLIKNMRKNALKCPKHKESEKILDKNCVYLQVKNGSIRKPTRMSEETEDIFEQAEETASDYTEDDIKTLVWNEHIRSRPGMYIGKRGDGQSADDGVYVLLKETIDNSVDEFATGFGRVIKVDIELDVTGGMVSVRDYGRGIPLGKLVDVASKINTGGKFDSDKFQKSVGLNGVGLKAVNALSIEFEIAAFRDGFTKRALFSCGNLIEESEIEPTEEPNGTLVRFRPDRDMFPDFKYLDEHVITMLKNYSFLNTGLTIIYNGRRMQSKNGLKDLLEDNMSATPLYPIIHLKGHDIEGAITHAGQYGEEFYSFVNGQHTTQGGTHLSAFKDALTRTLKDYYNRNFEPSHIRNGMVAAISIRVQEPLFESQTKTKLGSRDVGPEGPSVAKFVGDFIKKELDNYLHREKDVAEAMLKKIQESERELKAIAGIAKKARETSKKVSLYNRKLNDCHLHLSDSKGDPDKKLATSIFITEGDSAGGSIEKVRDVATQAVFKLRGKPKNTFGASKKELYGNEEFSLLQAALNIEESIDTLRYNKVIIATDADVDGMHIRILMLTFFLQYFPDLVKKGHVYVLQTPLFRVRNGKVSRKGSNANEETIYCYTEAERIAAIQHFGENAEITRFKGLGEISPEEFRGFIGPDMRLDRVHLRKDDGVGEILEFFMGKNTMDRQSFIIDNLIVEDDSNLDKE